MDTKASPTEQTIPPESLAVLFRSAAHLIAVPAEASWPLLTGWYTDLTGPIPRYCTVGALRTAAGVADTDEGDPLSAAAIRFLSSRIVSATVDEDPVERIADWHDHPGRTAAEVVAALLKAARDMSAPVADAAHLAEQQHQLDAADAGFRALAPTGGAL